MECTHSWKIEPVEGKTSTGVCCLCGRERQHPNTYSVPATHPFVRKPVDQAEEDFVAVMEAFRKRYDYIVKRSET